MSDGADTTGRGRTSEPSPLALLALIRWPGVVTACANSAAGFLLAHRPEHASSEIVAAAVVAAGGLVYAGGVALNDVADWERDRSLHPARPIPSGRVSRASSLVFGLTLLFAGVLLAFVMAGSAAGLAVLCAAAAALVYDAFGKASRLPGALLMGVARGANALAGACAAAGSFEMLLSPPVAAAAAARMALLFPVAIAVYTALLTYVSTFEERAPGRRGIAFLTGALISVAVLPWPLFLVTGWRLAPAPAFLLLAGSVLIGGRDAIGTGRVGLLVRSAVFVFPLLDAAWLAGIGKYQWSAGWLIGWVALRLLLARVRS